VIAVIPARGGSKGVPGKNLRRVGGRSLVERAVDSCRAARHIDAVYVSTDDAEIARVAEEAGASVIVRPPALASDSASSESALLHALDQLSREGSRVPDLLAFVQCTSPFIRPGDLDRGAELIMAGVADSAFSAVPTYEFLWRATEGPTNGAVPLLVGGQNHDPGHRPRRQDREPDYRETGAFYLMSVPGFRDSRHRFFGRTAAITVPELTAIEIDDEHELIVANALAATLGSEQPPDVDVDAVITDFDGVHTDDLATIDQDGRETVRVSRADGLGIERLRAAGVDLLIVSKETKPVVRARAAKLGIEVLQGVEEKTAAVRDWLVRRGIPARRAAYLGNDVNDRGPMGLVGWPVAVADARPEIRQLARLVLDHPGGHGAVRELCDLVLAARQRERPQTTWPPLDTGAAAWLATGGGSAAGPVPAASR
jgi:YrbI family 3-deoxy-D-manno-octulosonate 8-phosphate phosphatase